MFERSVSADDLDRLKQAREEADGAYNDALTVLDRALPVPPTRPHQPDAGDEHILINTEVHRRKFKNMMANPTVTVLIVHRNDPWSYVEVRGEVTGTVTGPVARSHIDALAHKYLAVDEYPRPITSERVICKITPTRIVKFPPG